jgi:2-C-methyl-D-erythritol 4-phosphate cytidylyltransferase
VQTPQAFDIQLHKQAYRQPYNDGFTDDASVVESFFSQNISPNSQHPSPITLVDGNRENIKITTPFDLKIAEVLADE